MQLNNLNRWSYWIRLEAILLFIAVCIAFFMSLFIGFMVTDGFRRSTRDLTVLYVFSWPLLAWVLSWAWMLWKTHKNFENYLSTDDTQQYAEGLTNLKFFWMNLLLGTIGFFFYFVILGMAF